MKRLFLILGLALMQLSWVWPGGLGLSPAFSQPPGYYCDPYYQNCTYNNYYTAPYADPPTQFFYYTVPRFERHEERREERRERHY